MMERGILTEDRQAGVVLKFKDQYRKRPVVINAVQVDATYFIQTLEGEMKANPGDYIIEGIAGELYPCKPDIFHKTYEKVV